MKIVKSLEESGLLIKGVSEKIENEAKKQKGGFPDMSLDIDICWQVMELFEQVKVRIFNPVSTFN